MSECGVEPVITVSLSRGEDPPLEVPPDCDGPGLWWNNLALPEWVLRYTYAPSSSWVPGALLLAAVTDAADLPLVIAVRGSSTADLEVRKANLEAVLRQWSYTVSIDVDGTSIGSWPALPTIPRWGRITPQRASLFVAEAEVSIPVNPAGAP